MLMTWNLRKDDKKANESLANVLEKSVLDPKTKFLMLKKGVEMYLSILEACVTTSVPVTTSDSGSNNEAEGRGNTVTNQPVFVRQFFQDTGLNRNFLDTLLLTFDPEQVVKTVDATPPRHMRFTC